VNSLSVALRAGYLSVRTAEGASEKQSSLKARLRNGLTYLLTYLGGKFGEDFIICPMLLMHCTDENVEHDKSVSCSLLSRVDTQYHHVVKCGTLTVIVTLSHHQGKYNNKSLPEISIIRCYCQ